MNLTTEARLLQLADKAGIPVPGVIYVLQPGDDLGEGYLMEWLEGETLGQRIVRSAGSVLTPGVLGRRNCLWVASAP